MAGWCGACGTPHAAGLRFCGACGAALPSPPRKGRRQNAVALVIAGIIAAIALLSWLGSLTAPAAAPPLASQSVAYKLAVIQSGHSLDQSDPLVGQMQRALDALRSQCTESETRLAAEAIVTQEDLARHGLADTDLAVLRSVRGSIPARFARTRCADIFAAWLVLREQGT